MCGCPLVGKVAILNRISKKGKTTDCAGETEPKAVSKRVKDSMVKRFATQVIMRIWGHE